jgi:hypothetical protein
LEEAGRAVARPRTKDLSARFAWQALEDGRRVLALIGLAEG